MIKCMNYTNYHARTLLLKLLEYNYIWQFVFSSWYHFLWVWSHFFGRVVHSKQACLLLCSKYFYVLYFLLLSLLDGGEAFSWGMGVSGRLGHGHESSILGFFRSNRFSPSFLLQFLAALICIEVLLLHFTLHDLFPK